MSNLTVDPQPQDNTSSSLGSLGLDPQRGSNPLKAVFIGILIFVLLSVTAYGAYWYGQSVTTAKSTPSTSSLNNLPAPKPILAPVDETANWKLYINSRYGFSLKYPTDWEFQESDGKASGIDINSFALDLAKNGELPPPGTISFIGVQLTESTDRRYFSLYDWTTVIGSMVIDGVSAEIRQHKTTKGEQVVVIKNGRTYTIANENADKNSQQNKIFDQILSTFKFL